MSRNGIIAVLAGAALLACAAFFISADKARAQGEAPEGRFAVVAAGEDFILHDTTDSAKSWILAGKGDKRAWMPVRRLDTEGDIQNWKIKTGASQGQ